MIMLRVYHTKKPLDQGLFIHNKLMPDSRRISSHHQHDIQNQDLKLLVKTFNFMSDYFD